MKKIFKVTLKTTNALKDTAQDKIEEGKYLELENGALSWKDLTKKDNGQFAQSVSSSLDIFDQLEQNFHEYSGLIYDGAFRRRRCKKSKRLFRRKQCKRNF